MNECPLDTQVFDFDDELGKRRVSVFLKTSKTARNFKLSVINRDTARLTKPWHAPSKKALEFLQENIDWLQKTTATAKESLTLIAYLKKNPRVYADGYEWSVWLKASNAQPFFIEDSVARDLVMMYAQDNPEESVEELLVKFAREKISALTREASEEADIKFGRITVRDQCSRWASRSSNGTLSFNWRIVLLPPELQKYIVRHELAHTHFMDHSVSFWLFLNRICPNAKRLDARLSKEGAQIFAIARR